MQRPDSASLDLASSVYDTAANDQHSRIQTDFCEVRERVVSKETVSTLRDLLSIDAFCQR